MRNPPLEPPGNAGVVVEFIPGFYSNADSISLAGSLRRSIHHRLCGEPAGDDGSLHGADERLLRVIPSQSEAGNAGSLTRTLRLASGFEQVELRGMPHDGRLSDAT